MLARNLFPSHRYVVHVATGLDAGEALGGFEEASGPETGPLMKIPGVHKLGDVTLKRGVVNSSGLWNWLTQARHAGPSTTWDAIVTLRNESGQPILSWKLKNAKPKKYTGPALGGKGGGDTAIEELVLSHESIELVPPR